MNFSLQLFKFLYQLTDVQIKKYVKLATVGIGPDAPINATLVMHEAEELLSLADDLLTSINTSSDSQEMVSAVYNQIRFYLEQEYLRAHAGWLLDTNNIHTEVYERTLKLLNELKEIGEHGNIDSSFPALATNSGQKQCQHDSNAIAFYILDIVVNLLADEQYNLDALPEHAQKIVRRNLKARYQDKDIQQQIYALHKTSKDYLETSNLHKSTEQLDRRTALSKEIDHRTKQNNLKSLFQQLYPNLTLLDENEDSKQTDSTLSIKSSFWTPSKIMTGALLIGSIVLAYSGSYYCENKLCL